VLDLYNEFRSLTQAIGDAGIEYALCGGLAMAVHAIPRATVDIDLMIEPGSLDEVRKVVGNLGYTVEAKPMAFAEGKVQIRRFTKLDPDSEDVLMLDLLLVTPAVREAWQTRARLEWGGGELMVVSREGLIQLKSIRGSAVDQEDISTLRGEKP